MKFYQTKQEYLCVCVYKRLLPGAPAQHALGWMLL